MKSPKRKNETRPGMWATVGTAVQSGWGPTLRLLSVFALAGILLGGIGVATGADELFDLFGRLMLTR